MESCNIIFARFTGAKAMPGVGRTSENNVWLKSDLVSLFLTNQISTLSTFLTYWKVRVHYKSQVGA